MQNLVTQVISGKKLSFLQAEHKRSEVMLLKKAKYISPDPV